MVCEYYNHLSLKSSIETDNADAYKRIERARHSARKLLVSTAKEHVLYAISVYDDNDAVVKIMLFSNTDLSDEELDIFISKYPSSLFYVFHKDTHYKVCLSIVEREIRPINLREANSFVNKYHRHHSGTVGCKFAIGLYQADKLIGVAICGRPVSRYLDTGTICEINRLCTVGDDNACSMLLGACSQIAKHMGYKKIITYILQSEKGVSLRASNFICEGTAGGIKWTGERDRKQNIPSEMKTRWVKNLA